VGAFREDPLWGWAFPGGVGLDEWWRYLAGSALRYPWTWIAGDFEAVSVWIPPRGIELTEEEEAGIAPLLERIAGPRALDIMVLMERFDESHPTERPHYYLSLLGTHPDHRGKGIGMGLLAENLALIDTEGAPAYLESSNSANVPRYERHGFRQVGGFERPGGGFTAATMWRDARRPGEVPFS
jgi:GNAT superfamily N-acetyltransferase